MELLSTPHNGGHPADYLLARIRVRRGYRIADWDGILAAADPLEAVPATPYRGGLAGRSEEQLWRSLLREFQWVQRQMEPPLRETFAPLFGWFELRTLALCLRNRAEGATGKVGELLFHSLLAERLKKVVLSDRDLPAVCRKLAEFLAFAAPRFSRLGSAYGERGLAGFEQELADLYLTGTFSAPLHPVVGEFFRRLIDTRNLMALQKQLRWRIKAAPRFIRGGWIGEGSLREAAQRRESAAIATLMERLTGRKIEISPAGGVEQPLLADLTRRVRRLGREAETGLILDYLWGCYVETRNLSLLVHGAGVDRETLVRELIR